jgi:putative aldouronate transport system substrate-binding protein
MNFAIYRGKPRPYHKIILSFQEEIMRFGKTLFLAILALVLAALPLAANGQRGGTAGTGGAASGTTGYPLNTSATISWWLEIPTNVSANYTSVADTPFGKGLQERTGVKINYLHPPAGGGNEQFNLLVASGDLPDIMERNWIQYPGGPEKAIEDGVVLKLNDIYPKYAPYLSAYFKANPDIDRMTKTDSGSYYSFPLISAEPILLTSAGPMIRQDWLDDLGLQMPTTIDEWHTVLTAFKEKKNSPAPLSFEYNSYFDSCYLFYAYHANRDFYVGDDGKIAYGGIENNYRDFLVTFSQWYKEGLVDPDLPTQQFQQVSAKITGNVSGATVGSLNSRMGVWTNAVRASNPKFKLAGVPVPVLKKGDKPFRGYGTQAYRGTGAAITGASKNQEIAARVLDYTYGPEGHLYYNFGVEGTTYKMVNGYPTYTDEVLNNPKGWPSAQVLASYSHAGYGGPYIQDARYILQVLTLPEQRQALDKWVWDGWLKQVVPSITPTPDESREFARIMNEINTYKNEMELKFILGTENLSSWSTYVSTIKRMGIDRAVEIQNAALARYNAR